MKTHKAFNIFMIITMIAMAMGAPMKVSAQNYAPRFYVNPFGGIYGYDWPASVQLTIEIDGVVVETAYTTSAGEFGVGHAQQHGTVVKVSYGDIVKTHTVTALEVTEVNPADALVDPNTVKGTTDSPAGSIIEVQNVDDNVLRKRLVEVQNDGTWVADFNTAVGEAPWDQPVNLGWAGGEAFDRDEDGDATVFGYSVPYIRFNVDPVGNMVSGHGWPAEISIAIDIDDGVFSATADTDENGSFYLDIDPVEFDIQPGNVITVSGNGIVRYLTVTALTITEVNSAYADHDPNTIKGTTDSAPGSIVGIYVQTRRRSAAVQEDGSWSADFNVAAGDEDWEQPYDLVPGTSGWAIDEGGEGYLGQTFIWWEIQALINPSFSARLTENQVHGYGWLLGSEVSLFIDGNEIGTQTVVVADWDPNGTFVRFDLGESLILQAGQFIEMTDGNITKTHTVTNLVVTAVDPVADTVFGKADTGTQVDIGHIYCDENGCFGFRHEIADSNGEWLAEFSEPGEDGDEQDVVDITPGMSSEARQFDEDGDHTQIDWRVPNPFVEAAPYSNWIHAREWPLGTFITLTIDDPSDGLGDVDYTATDTVHQAPWNSGGPNEFLAEFNWPNQFEPGPGYIITASGNGQSKTMTVSQLKITDLDLDADTISGIGTPGVEVQFCVKVPNNCITRWVTPDGYGNWTANYHNPGTGKDDPSTLDIQQGSSGWAAEYEEDSDRTWYDWRMPGIVVGQNWDGVFGHDWPLGASVTLTIHDPNTGPGVDYTETQIVTSSPGGTDLHFDLDGFDVRIGHIVTFSDGATIKELIVSRLQITAFNADLDRVYGVAEPFGNLQVDVRQNGGGPPTSPSLYLTADENGNWTADFSGLWDITTDHEVFAHEIDNDGDVTLTIKGFPNFVVQLGTNHIDGWNWIPNGEVTININGSEAATIQTNEMGAFGTDFDGLDPFIPGMDFVVTDGLNTKAMTTAVLEITNVDVESDTVTGLADSGQILSVWVHENWPGVQVSADISGIWTADFSGVWDIVPSTSGAAQVNDDDRDGSRMDWSAPNPTFGVRVNDNTIEGWGWTLGSTVTIGIDDPTTTDDPNPMTAIVGVADWDPNQTFVKFQVQESGFTLQPDQQITMTDGATTKTHFVTSLDVTNVDPNADTVSGTALTGSRVDVWYCNENGCVNRHETATGGDVSGSVDAAQVADQFVPSILWGYNTAVQDYDYNPVLARDLLADAGYPDGFTVNLWIRDVPRIYLPQAMDTAQAIKEYLGDVGITANVEMLESGEFIDRVWNGEADLFLLGWGADFDHPDNFYYHHFCS
ncbi:MAG: ABC transporter substrate-binding protein, partial [Chloroflexota bacterium]